MQSSDPSTPNLNSPDHHIKPSSQHSANGHPNGNDKEILADSNDGLLKLMSLPERQQVLAVAIALQANSKETKTAAQQQKDNEQFEFAKTLHQCLNQYTQQVIDLISQKMDDLLDAVEDLYNYDQLCERKSAWGSRNSIAHFFDSIVENIYEYASPLSALKDACKLYLSNTADAERNALSVDDYRATLELEAKGLLKIADIIEKKIQDFPELCSSLQRSLKREKSLLKRLYEERDSAKKSEYGDEYEDLTTNSRGPLFKSNPFLTHFLNEIISEIPEKIEGESHDELFVDEIDQNSFIDYVSKFNDEALLGAIKEQNWYRTTGEALNHLDNIFRELRDISLELKKIRKSNPAELADNYSKLLDNVKMTASPDGSDTFEKFNISEATHFLNSFYPGSKSDEAVANSTDFISEKDRAYIALYERIEKSLEDKSFSSSDFDILDEKDEEEQDNSDAQRIETLKELVELKKEIQPPEIRKTTSQIQLDRKEGNYAFTATQEGMGSLTLKRVATHGVAYEDVKGASWSRVKDKLQGLLEYSELGYVYSHMSARGKSNNNMLIIGPYGCGKNMFLKALTSDPRTIGVNVTTDRVVSMWYGQAEANIRRLFENSYAKREEYDKPVVISWDEFDSLYPSASDPLTSRTDSGMQKVLQSVLDGDTIYDGVSLIGLTNEPRKIPVPIYRRFANVEIIQPLSGEERVGLLTGMMAGLPQTEGFENAINWNAFIKNTEFASGDILGKIYDEVYQSFLTTCKNKDTKILYSVNREAKEMVLSGIRLTASDRLEIFRKHAPDIEITPEIFCSSMESVLAKRDIASAITQQRLFYVDVEKLMEEAFKSSI